MRVPEVYHSSMERRTRALAYLKNTEFLDSVEYPRNMAHQPHVDSHKIMVHLQLDSPRNTEPHQRVKTIAHEVCHKNMESQTSAAVKTFQQETSLLILMERLCRGLRFTVTSALPLKSMDHLNEALVLAPSQGTLRKNMGHLALGTLRSGQTFRLGNTVLLLEDLT